MTETERIYLLVLQKIEQIDEYLDAGYHYRDTTGRPLLHLDQCVLAIQQNRWAGTPIANETEQNNGHYPNSLALPIALAA